MIWTYWWSFWQIETWPCGKAERSNILALFALTQLKFICLAKCFIAPARHLFINRYLQATAHHSPIIYLWLKLSVRIHREADEPLTHSVLLIPRSLIPPRFNCFDCHQHHLSLSMWPLCRPNQSGNNWRGTHIPLIWTFRILDANDLLDVRFNIRCATISAVICII